MSSGLSIESIDAETAGRIDVHLERAVEATDGETKDFHVRHARQLLEAARE